MDASGPPGRSNFPPPLNGFKTPFCGLVCQRRSHIGLELPLGLESRFARVADGTDQGPGTLKPFSVLLEDMEELADVVGLELPTYIKRRYVGTSRLDPLDFADDGVEYIIRFNKPSFGGPVNFRVYQMLFAFNVMVENWKRDLAKEGIVVTDGPDLFQIIG